MPLSPSFSSDALSIEMDEMWSDFCKNKNRSWLLWAVEHDTNTPLAFVFGPII